MDGDFDSFCQEYAEYWLGRWNHEVWTLDTDEWTGNIDMGITRETLRRFVLVPVASVSINKLCSYADLKYPSQGKR